MFPAPLEETATALRTGELDLLAYINQLCDLIDESEPRIQALLPDTERRARLLHDAQELQIRFPDPASRPPLFGIPVGIKDIFSVDSFPTRAGSQLPVDLFIGPESDCVQTLRAAGALILGKTVTAHFCWIRETTVSISSSSSGKEASWLPYRERSPPILATSALTRL
jgi:Asp-tRNA(Asn)/Glu-tRNA(Gln) amidotransferase A subunit family amidase